MSMLGKRLREQRGSRTQEEIAKMLGISRARYSHYENEHVQPDNDMLQKMADIYDVSVDYLLGRTDNPKQILSKGTVEFLKVIDIKDDNEAIEKLKPLIVHGGKEVPEEIIREILSYARYKLSQRS